MFDTAKYCEQFAYFMHFGNRVLTDMCLNHDIWDIVCLSTFEIGNSNVLIVHYAMQCNLKCSIGNYLYGIYQE